MIYLVRDNSLVVVAICRTYGKVSVSYVEKHAARQGEFALVRVEVGDIVVVVVGISKQQDYVFAEAFIAGNTVERSKNDTSSTLGRC